MRKELIVAIFLGGILGLAIAFGVWRFTNSFSKETNESTEVAQETIRVGEDSEAPVVATTTNGISIVRPQNNAVTNEETIEIAGIAQPNSKIVIIGEDDYVVETNSGTFEKTIEVAGGVNEIPIYMLTEDGQSQKTTITVVYSREVETVDAARAILGTVTDITEATIQVRLTSGEISQIAIDENTSYVSTVQTTEDITFEDLAIGDYISAIGSLDEDDVLNAIRIIVSSPLSDSDEIVAYGQVQTLTNRDFIVANEQTGDEWSVDATDSPSVTTANDEGEIESVRLTSNAEEGDWIIIVGTLEDEELIARRIHIL